jgi:hypothetical protein
MLEDIFKMLFVLGFVATIVAVIAVAFALVLPMKETGRRVSNDVPGARHV